MRACSLHQNCRRACCIRAPAAPGAGRTLSLDESMSLLSYRQRCPNLPRTEPVGGGRWRYPQCPNACVSTASATCAIALTAPLCPLHQKREASLRHSKHQTGCAHCVHAHCICTVATLTALRNRACCSTGVQGELEAHQAAILVALHARVLAGAVSPLRSLRRRAHCSTGAERERQAHQATPRLNVRVLTASAPLRSLRRRTHCSTRC